LNASFNVTFKIDAPTIVMVKRIASRFQCRFKNSTTTTAVAIVRKIVDPRNDMPRIADVIAGEAN